jgi:hypothetical protein
MEKRLKQLESVDLPVSIKKISFVTGFVCIHLIDGRIVQFKLSSYPMLRKLKYNERKKLTTITQDEGQSFNLFTFDACDEMFILDDKLNLIVD